MDCRAIWNEDFAYNIDESVKRKLKTIKAEHLQDYMDFLSFGGTNEDGTTAKPLSVFYSDKDNLGAVKLMSTFQTPENLMLLMVGMVWQRFDRDIFKYIDMPAETELIRISPNEFEIDKNDREIHMAKRE